MTGRLFPRTMPLLLAQAIQLVTLRAAKARPASKLFPTVLGLSGPAFNPRPGSIKNICSLPVKSLLAVAFVMWTTDPCLPVSSIRPVTVLVGRRTRVLVFVSI